MSIDPAVLALISPSIRPANTKPKPNATAANAGPILNPNPNPNSDPVGPFVYDPVAVSKKYSDFGGLNEQQYQGIVSLADKQFGNGDGYMSKEEIGALANLTKSDQGLAQLRGLRQGSDQLDDTRMRRLRRGINFLNDTFFSLDRAGNQNQQADNKAGIFSFRNLAGRSGNTGVLDVNDLRGFEPFFA